jgi:hypothetical protein
MLETSSALALAFGVAAVRQGSELNQKVIQRTRTLNENKF